MMIQRIRRIYVEGCAVGGAFNRRLADETRPFWDAVRDSKIIVIVSDVLDKELRKAPERARNHIYELSTSQFERVETTEETKELAMRYIAEKVVGETSFDVGISNIL